MLNYRKFKEINELFMGGRVEEARRALMELQARYIALCDEVSILKKQVHEFEDIFFLAQNLFLEEQHYWLKTGSVRHGPFCRLCYDYTGKLIRLEEHKNVYRCPYCGLLHGRQPVSGRTAPGDEDAPLPRGKIIPFRFSRKCC